MPVSTLKISGVRNLKQVSIACGRINILSGANGSGKTSTLEAIHILGLGRSFRSTRLKPVINHELAECSVFSELSSGSSASTLGVCRKAGGKSEFRINREPVKSIADLARVLPLQVINADAYSLVDGGPKFRRQFLDWGVFHVKPEFLASWRTAQRSLKQRNSLLRRGKMLPREMVAWDNLLVEAAESIDRDRTTYVESVRPVFNTMLRRLMDVGDIDLVYRRGWDDKQRLADVLKANSQQELQRGYTLAGPHRATIDIVYRGGPAAETLSRGQQKLLVCALKLAQGLHFAENRGENCIYLLDDLPSELDSNHRQTLCELLDEMDCQVFITCVEASQLEGFWSDRDKVSLFHVEQGEIQPTGHFNRP